MDSSVHPFDPFWPESTRVPGETKKAFDRRLKDTTVKEVVPVELVFPSARFVAAGATPDEVAAFEAHFDAMEDAGKESFLAEIGRIANADIAEVIQDRRLAAVQAQATELAAQAADAESTPEDSAKAAADEPTPEEHSSEDPPEPQEPTAAVTEVPDAGDTSSEPAEPEEKPAGAPEDEPTGEPTAPTPEAPADTDADQAAVEAALTDPPQT